MPVKTMNRSSTVRPPKSAPHHMPSISLNMSMKIGHFAQLGWIQDLSGPVDSKLITRSNRLSGWDGINLARRATLSPHSAHCPSIEVMYIIDDQSDPRWISTLSRQKIRQCSQKIMDSAPIPIPSKKNSLSQIRSSQLHGSRISFKFPPKAIKPRSSTKYL